MTQVTLRKACTRCREEKPLDHFTKRAAAKSGLDPWCRPCRAAYHQENKARASAQRRERYANNRESELAQKAEYRAANKDTIREVNARYRAKNKDREAEYRAQWQRSNPGKVRASCSKRRAAKLQRTPAWANGRVIQALYAFAKWLEDVSGASCQVDHIVPLQGATVSGLHCEANLRVILATDNKRKSAKVDPDAHAIPSEIDLAGFRQWLKDNGI